jgi:hypothetical protein
LSVEKNHPLHPKQLHTHLVLANLQRGLALNFGLERMKAGLTRIVNGLPERPRPKQGNRMKMVAQSRRTRRKRKPLKTEEILTIKISIIFG